MNWNKAIFLAHAAEDKPIVRVLYQTLLKSGLEPWFDEESLEPGAKWEDKIKEAIKKSRFFLACISKHSVSKNGFIQKELRLALGELERKSSENMYFIPALLENIELPNISVSTVNLSDYQAVKLFDTKSLNKLIQSLQRQVNVIQTEAIKRPNVSEIKKLIMDGKIENALKILKTISENTDYENNVILLLGRFNRLKIDYLNGVLTHMEQLMEHNKINLAILDIIDLLSIEI